jgi:selenocysteine-specific elongation factor
MLRDQPVTSAGRDRVVRLDALAELSDRVKRLLADASVPLPREHLAAALPDASEGVLDTALVALTDAGAVLRTPAGLSLHNPEQERFRARAEAALTQRFAESLRATGLTPDLPEDLRTHSAAAQILNRLVRDGVLVRTRDSGKQRGVIFHADAIRLAMDRLRPMLADASEGLLVGEIGAALRLTRKYCVPLLAHLDDIRFTRRLGDRRVLCCDGTAGRATNLRHQTAPDAP